MVVREVESEQTFIVNSQSLLSREQDDKARPIVYVGVGGTDPVIVRRVPFRRSSAEPKYPHSFQRWSRHFDYCWIISSNKQGIVRRSSASIYRLFCLENRSLSIGRRWFRSLGTCSNTRSSIRSSTKRTGQSERRIVWGIEISRSSKSLSEDRRRQKRQYSSSLLIGVIHR